MEFGIYTIKNIVNNKIYIGSSVNIKRRWDAHKTALKHNKHKAVYLQRSYNKYGKDNFLFEILEVVKDKNLILTREQYYIDTLNPEYNTCKKAGNTLGFKHSEKTIEKFRIYNKKINRKPPPRPLVRVDQFDLSGNYITTFNSIKEAAEKSNSLPSHIVEVCKNKLNKHKGYIWKYNLK